jgi:hypothetical protein
MSTDDFVEIVAVVGALLSLAFGIYQYAARRRQESLTEIIQGEKETAAAAAVRILSKKRGPRRPELQALCLASVFERSGRTRSLIHGALKAQQVNHPDEIRGIVDQITMVIGRNASYTNLTRARRRLISLRSALSLDGDTRTRIDAIEVCTALQEWTPRRRVAASTKRIAGLKSDNPCCCLGSWYLYARQRRRTVQINQIESSECLSSLSTITELRRASFPRTAGHWSTESMRNIPGRMMSD